jgi:hypothetical protein
MFEENKNPVDMYTHKGNMVCPANSYSFNILQDYTHNGGVHVHRILIFIKYSLNDR